MSPDPGPDTRRRGDTNSFLTLEHSHCGGERHADRTHGGPVPLHRLQVPRYLHQTCRPCFTIFGFEKASDRIACLAIIYNSGHKQHVALSSKIHNRFLKFESIVATSSEYSIIPNIIKHRLHVLYLPQRGYHDYITITAPRMNVKFIYCVKCGMNESRTELQRLYQHPNHFVCSRLLRALHTQVYRSKLSKVSTIKVSQYLTI